MKVKRHNRRIVAVAWALLFILTSAMMLKDLHHHDIDNGITAKTVITHNQQSFNNNDVCPICQFTFFPTVAATAAFHLFVVVILLGVQLCGFIHNCSHKELLYHPLRAPPSITA